MVKVLSKFPGLWGPGRSGAGGEMASSETEASPPSRRRPPMGLPSFGVTGQAAPPAIVS